MKDAIESKPVINDGGFVFPTLTDIQHRSFAYEVRDANKVGMTFPVIQQTGMSLREYFAGQALAGELASSNTCESAEATARASIKAGRTVAQQIAAECVECADAMIAELKRKP